MCLCAYVYINVCERLKFTLWPFSVSHAPDIFILPFHWISPFSSSAPHFSAITSSIHVSRRTDVTCRFVVGCISSSGKWRWPCCVYSLGCFFLKRWLWSYLRGIKCNDNAILFTSSFLFTIKFKTVYWLPTCQCPHAPTIQPLACDEIFSFHFL